MNYVYVNWYKKAQGNVEVDYFADKWQNVDSSFIEKVAYYEPLGMFEIRLKNGREYSYKDVPKEVYDAFMDAARQGESLGKFFNSRIKNTYEHEEKAR